MLMSEGGGGELKMWDAPGLAEGSGGTSVHGRHAKMDCPAVQGGVAYVVDGHEHADEDALCKRVQTNGDCAPQFNNSKTVWRWLRPPLETTLSKYREVAVYSAIPKHHRMA